VVCHPKDQGGFAIHDIEVKNIALLDKWLLSFLLKRGFGKPFLGESILVHVCCLKFTGNLVTRTSRVVLWQRRKFSSPMSISQLGMNYNLDSGRING
jgi:hypothetical protein